MRRRGMMRRKRVPRDSKKNYLEVKEFEGGSGR